MIALTKSFPARRSAAGLLLPLVLLTVAACSGTDRDEVTYVERPPEELYTEAMQTLEDGRQKRAANLFDEVERQHPYSQWATRAQLMAAYAMYQAMEYDDAVIALDRFRIGRSHV